jgi:hypothetical protein
LLCYDNLNFQIFIFHKFMIALTLHAWIVIIILVLCIHTYSYYSNSFAHKKKPYNTHLKSNQIPCHLYPKYLLTHPTRQYFFFWFFLDLRKLYSLESVLCGFRWASKTPVVPCSYKRCTPWLKLETCCVNLKLFTITPQPLRTRLDNKYTYIWILNIT